MNLRSEFLIPLAWRTAVSIVPFSAGCWLLTRVTGPGDILTAIVAAVLVALPAFIIAPPIARLIGDVSGWLYFPDSTDRKPPPTYSLPRARRMQGRFEEAMAIYDRIVREYPQEIEAYLDMVDIAINDLKDLGRAERIARGAVAVLSNPHDRERLGMRLREGRQEGMGTGSDQA